MKYEKEYIGAPLNNITSNGDAIPNCRISFLNGADYYKITTAVNTYLKSKQNFMYDITCIKNNNIKKYNHSLVFLFSSFSFNSLFLYSLIK